MASNRFLAKSPAELKPQIEETTVSEETTTKKNKVKEPEEEAETDVEEAKKSAEKQKAPKPKKQNSDLLELFQTDKERGLGKMVYFDRKNYEYIEEIKKTSNMSFSNIVNVMLEDFIKRNPL